MNFFFQKARERARKNNEIKAADERELAEQDAQAQEQAEARRRKRMEKKIH